MRRLWVKIFAAALVALGLTACESPSWPAYRHSGLRQGQQRDESDLSDPAKVPSLAVRWTFTPPAGEGGSFYASPIVIKHRVFIGSTAGYFYALDAKTGSLLWQYPAHGHPLMGTCAGGGGTQTFGQYGVMSSAAAFDDDKVVFGAPDPTAETGLGSARLFALRQNDGSVVWTSDVVAHVNGCTPGNVAPELHERIAYSAPLVSEDAIYVGIHDAGDDPIQNGKVMAVERGTGHLLPGFSYESTSTRGGGVWNGPTQGDDGILFTTGNTRCDGAGCQPAPGPAINRGLSLVKIHRKTGNVIWQFQPVPYDLDDDPDWSAGVTEMGTSCGRLATSVQKDGWSYALEDGNGSCRWQFPPTAGPGCKFAPGGAHIHGDTDYKRPGAAWGDVLVINTGGEALVHDGVGAGYGRLHALNACAPDELHRVRWLVDVPNSSGSGYSIGAPTITGGVVYVTTDQGHVVALADPLIAPASGYRCSDIDFGTMASCTLAGYAWVPVPKVLADVPLDGSSAAGLRNEAAIAHGRLFVGTLGGHVYMLSP